MFSTICRSYITTLWSCFVFNSLLTNHWSVHICKESSAVVEVEMTDDECWDAGEKCTFCHWGEDTHPLVETLCSSAESVRRWPSTGCSASIERKRGADVYSDWCCCWKCGATCTLVPVFSKFSAAPTQATELLTFLPPSQFDSAPFSPQKETKGQKDAFPQSFPQWFLEALGKWEGLVVYRI